MIKRAYFTKFSRAQKFMHRCEECGYITGIDFDHEKFTLGWRVWWYPSPFR